MVHLLRFDMQASPAKYFVSPQLPTDTSVATRSDCRRQRRQNGATRRMQVMCTDGLFAGWFAGWFAGLFVGWFAGLCVCACACVGLFAGWFAGLLVGCVVI